MIRGKLPGNRNGTVLKGARASDVTNTGPARYRTDGIVVHVCPQRRLTNTNKGHL